jgi:hypothetical protein
VWLSIFSFHRSCHVQHRTKTHRHQRLSHSSRKVNEWNMSMAFRDEIHSLLLWARVYPPWPIQLDVIFSLVQFSFVSPNIFSCASFEISKRKQIIACPSYGLVCQQTFMSCSLRLSFVDFNCSIVRRFDRRLMSDGCVRICLTGSNLSTKFIDSIMITHEHVRKRTLLLWINKEYVRFRCTIFRIDQMRRWLNLIDFLSFELMFIFNIFEILCLH